MIPTQDCGAGQFAIIPNGGHAEYHPTVHMRDITFTDTREEAMFYITSPNPKWANLNDCGTFTCTGLYQYLIIMEGIRYTGSPLPFGVPTDF